MKKKLRLVVAALICSFSVGYAFNDHKMSAASVYTAGGNVTGRVNQAPSNLSGIKTNIGMKKGDRYYLGSNTIGDGSPVGWQLITDNIKTGTVSEPSWLAMTTKSLKEESAFSSNQNFYVCLTIGCTLQSNGTLASSVYQYVGNAQYDNSNLKSTIQAFNTQWSDESLSAIIGTHTLTRLKQCESNFIGKLDGSNTWAYTMLKEYTRTSSSGKTAFYIHYFDYISGNIMNYGTITQGFDIPQKDYAFTSIYHMHDPYQDSYAKNATMLMGANGKLYHNTDNTLLNPYSVRPSIFIQKTPIVFAVSPLSSSSSIGLITQPLLPNSYTNITTDAIGKEMKIRRLDTSMNVSLDSVIRDHSGHSLIKKGNSYQAVKDKVIQIRANGNVLTSNSTISILIFDQNGDFVGYSPLGKATGSMSDYEVNLTGLNAGNYQIAVVNEEYDAAKSDPSKSSLISDVISLQITESLSDVTFTPQYGLEYNKNVNTGNIVGTISSKNGAGTPRYAIIADPAYPNEYQNLTLASDGKTVIVKAAPLHGGTYHFKIQAHDENGDPNPAIETAASIMVSKDTLSVAFDDPNQTKKSITEATAGWSETAAATPNDGVKVTYDKVSGDIGLIDIDPDTGAIIYKESGAYGKVTIRAIADDDPSTGYDDYNSVTATKEIIIYAEVNGGVTPHTNSSDINTPTFTANDPNVKTGGTIGTIKGAPGTPDNVTSGGINYTFGLKSDGDGSFFAVNASSGDITTKANLSVGSYHITVTVSDKWSTKEIPVTINVGVAQAEDLKFYETSAAINAITTKSAKVTDTNVRVYATVKGSSNPNQVTYKIKDGSTNVIEVNNNGDVKINGVGTVIIVAEKKGVSGQADAQAELTFTVTAGAQNFIYTDNAGNELPKTGTIYNAKTEVYEPSKTFQLYTAGNPTGSTVTYQLKVGSPTDVISVDNNGLVTILNASLNNQMGKVIVQATSHDPSGNYSDKMIDLPINIEKGTRTITFAENPIYVSNGKGKVTPVTEVDGVTDTAGDVLIEVDSKEDGTVAWTNDNQTIDYNYSGQDGIDIKIHATKPMDRNYKATEADGMIYIMGPDENVLAITSPGQIIYGDHFTIKSTQYDADSTNVQYTFEIDDTTYLSNPTVTGNVAEFDALKYSAGKKTTITVTRTADGETPLSKKVQVTVMPKPIEIIIDDQEKCKGEANPALTYQDFRTELVSWSGVQDIIQENDIKLSTTANANSNAGSYPIKGDANTLNKTYPNYSFSFKGGILTIKEENIEDDWYHLEVDDGNNTVYTGNWTNQNVNIISDHSEYINLSLDQSTWNPNQVTVTKEGETNQSFWMKKDSGAITKEKQETIRIDKTAPKVKGIKAKDTNNTLQDIINKLSGGIFFQPGTSFEITTDDSKDDLKISGTKEIAYKVYKIDAQARSRDELISDGTLTVTNEKASITISETVGTYKVCIIPTDNAGNTNIESCHEVELKKIDVDVDKDGKPDFNDSDGDGCPDLNIKWKDPNISGKWIVINGDRDYDSIPDLNIDSDGDGKPDLNVDTDNDGKPDLNLVIFKKSDWKPTKCVKADIDNRILEEYCTGTSVKAVINIDIDGDGIPDINIDTNGDMKADLNITKAGSTEPYLNLILPQHVWEPKQDYKSGTFVYDSIGKHDPVVNIDTDGDGLPDVNIDLDGDLEPDINIDVDGDLIPDIDIDSNGDGKADVNVDTNGDGKADENIIEIKEWKPNKNIDGEFPYDTMDFSDSGEPKEPDDPNKSDHPVTPSTSVKGMYNPVNSMGGANTGDTTNLLLYIELCSFTLGTVFYMTYKQNSKN